MPSDIADILILGAGPVGNFLAYRLALLGFKVKVLEEHPEIGEPVHCTGIVGEKVIREFSIPERFIEGTINQFSVFAPQGEKLSLPLNSAVYMLKRREFDGYFADQAKAAGAEYYLATRALYLEQNNEGVKVTAEKAGEQGIFNARLLILATGSMSRLPYRYGIAPPPAFIRTLQSEVKIKGLKGAEIYLGRALAPGSFAYAVSANEGAGKLGLLVEKGIKDCYRHLVQSSHLKERELTITNSPVVRRIPLGFSPRPISGRLIAVGDAAGQVKATTGGGIYFGLKCAELLVLTLKNSRQNGDFALKELSLYPQKFKQLFGREIYWGKMVRSLFKNVSDDILNQLIKLLNQPKMKDLIVRKGDYDCHKRLIIPLLLAPGIRSFAWELFKHNLKEKKRV